MSSRAISLSKLSNSDKESIQRDIATLASQAGSLYTASLNASPQNAMLFMLGYWRQIEAINSLRKQLAEMY